MLTRTPAFISLSLLTTSLLAASPASAASSQTPLQVDCTSPTNSTSFETWLNALLSALDASGNTGMEGVVAGMSEYDDGYEVLEGMWDAVVGGSEDWTMLVPTDSAFTAAGLTSPYSSLPDSTLYPLLTYHIVPSSFPSLPATPAHAIVDTLLPLSDLLTEANTTETGEPLVLEAAGSGAQVRLGKANATIADLTGISTGNYSSVLGKLTLLSVDTVLATPSDLSDVLTDLSNSGSSSVSLYAAALSNTNTLSTVSGVLNGTSTNATTSAAGLTIFAPINSAFSDLLTSSDVSAWTKVLAGHYSTAQTVYSTDFDSTSSIFMASGYPATIVTNSSGTFILSGDGTGSSAKVLRSDVLIEGGGVLHTVDELLSATSLMTSQTTTTGSGSTSSALMTKVGGATAALGLMAVGLSALL